jgi:hypothetical protein
MHGDNIRKAIKKAEHGNEVRKGVNEYGKTAWNSWMKKEYPMENAMKTDKPTKHVKKSGATPGATVGEQVDKVRKTNLKARAINDYAASTGGERTRNENRKAFRVNSLKHNKPGQAKSTAPSENRHKDGKYITEAGGGVIPSGTNTNVPKYKAQAGCDPMEGRRKKPDGSYGY